MCIPTCLILKFQAIMKAIKAACCMSWGEIIAYMSHLIQWCLDRIVHQKMSFQYKIIKLYLFLQCPLSPCKK